MAKKFVVSSQPIENNLTSIVPPIECPCLVNNRRPLARVTQGENHPLTTLYHLSSGNGYKTSFFSIEHETGFYEWNKGYSDYPKGVAGDLKCFGGFQLDRDIFCLTMDESGENKNVWIRQDDEQDNKYNVRTPGNETTFRFSVMKTAKGWLVGLQDMLASTGIKKR